MHNMMTGRRRRSAGEGPTLAEEEAGPPAAAGLRAGFGWEEAVEAPSPVIML